MHASFAALVAICAAAIALVSFGLAYIVCVRKGMEASVARGYGVVLTVVAVVTLPLPVALLVSSGLLFLKH